jgi:hypothetical protein
MHLASRPRQLRGLDARPQESLGAFTVSIGDINRGLFFSLQSGT